jgi:hypothetical protein
MDGRVRVWFAPGLFPPGQEPYRIGGDLETAAAGSMMSKAATCSHAKVLWARLRQPAGRLAYSTATRLPQYLPLAWAGQDAAMLKRAAMLADFPRCMRL